MKAKSDVKASDIELNRYKTLRKDEAKTPKRTLRVKTHVKAGGDPVRDPE